MTGNSPKAEIMSQGEEVVSGAIVDSNAAWLAQELIGLGFDVTRHTAVGDRLDDLAGLLGEIAERADCCVCTGGLGPTVDDLTAEAAARVFGRPLELDEQALRAIRDWYDRRGVSMPETNRKQALLPTGSLRLDNRWGTAPGFSFQQGRCRFYFLPGVPWEMRGIFAASVRPSVADYFQTRPPHNIVLRTVGVGESTLQALMDQISLPAEACLGFCVVGAEVHVKLRLPAEFDETSIRTVTQDARLALGDAVFSIEGTGEMGGDLATVIGRLLSRRNASLAIAETVSAGLLSGLCASLDCLRESRVYPHAEALYRALEMESSSFSETLSANAAQQLHRLTGADFVLLQLDSATEPSDLHVAMLTPTGVLHFNRSLGSEPFRRRLLAAASTLDPLRRYLLAAS